MGTGNNNTVIDTSQPEFSFRDSSINEGFLPNHHLSISIGSYSFGFCLIDLASNVYLAVEKICFPEKNTEQLCLYLTDVLISNSLLAQSRKSAKSSSLSIANKFATVVPTKYSEKETVFDLMVMSFGEMPDFESYSDKLGDTEVNCHYLVPSQIVKTCKSFLPDVTIRHDYSVFANASLDVYGSSGGRQLFVHFGNRLTSVILIEGKRILFSNTFQSTSDRDVLYYLLNVIQQTATDISSISLSVSGDIELNTEKKCILADYFPNIKTIEFSSEILVPVEMSNNSHNHFNLLNQHKCVL